MAEPSLPEKDLLFLAISNMMGALLEINGELTNIRSALSALSRGDADAAKKSVADAFEDATKFHIEFGDALDNLKKWTRTPHV